MSNNLKQNQLDDLFLEYKADKLINIQKRLSKFTKSLFFCVII
jgi:hypothetical protein